MRTRIDPDDPVPPTDVFGKDGRPLLTEEERERSFRRWRASTGKEPRPATEEEVTEAAEAEPEPGAM